MGKDRHTGFLKWEHQNSFPFSVKIILLKIQCLREWENIALRIKIMKVLKEKANRDFIECNTI